MADFFSRLPVALSPEQGLAVDMVKATAEGMRDDLVRYVHPGPRLDLAITALEQSVLWALQGIVLR